MYDLSIEYAEPPVLIVFRIDDDLYVLQYEASAVRIPFTLIHVGNGSIKTANINEWLALKTHGRYSFDTLKAMSESFANGYAKAYTIDDIIACSELAFQILRHKLFVDGMASQYAGICTIECMPMSAIKNKLRQVTSGKLQGLDIESINRFVTVCTKNGWHELSSSWEKLLELEKFDDVPSESRKTPATDLVLRRLMQVEIRKRFTKHQKPDFADGS